MRIEQRQLHFGSLLSAGISSLIVIYCGYRFASTLGVWSVVTTQEKALWSLGLAGGLALIISSVLHTAIGSKWIGVSHGVLMAIAATVVCVVSVHSLIDLRNHPRGGFVEMAAFPICGGLLIFGILAGGSALQTFNSMKKKEPNQTPEPTAAAGRGSS